MTRYKREGWRFRHWSEGDHDERSCGFEYYRSMPDPNGATEFVVRRCHGHAERFRCLNGAAEYFDYALRPVIAEPRFEVDEDGDPDWLAGWDFSGMDKHVALNLVVAARRYPKPPLP